MRKTLSRFVLPNPNYFTPTLGTENLTDLELAPATAADIVPGTERRHNTAVTAQLQNNTPARQDSPVTTQGLGVSW
ncbi:hypothetical protein E2C01_028413 [Portunus trituberculatus]|uniref:Uncharacterized protein n=1 Tax=Portunus trituberculatus TaxID=210409 RepID=A0A5B7EP24_PORTR|nr:hypothetical protein [Portunus trituberculatus]